MKTRTLTKENPLTLKEFEAFPAWQVFHTGTDPEIGNYICIKSKSGVMDWAIYYDRAFAGVGDLNDQDYLKAIASYGGKVPKANTSLIKALVSVNPEVLNLYRK